MAEKSKNNRIECRKEKVQAFCKAMEAKGYVQADLTISAEDANSRSVLVILPFIAVYAVAFGLIAGWKAYLNTNVSLLSSSIIVSIIIHELIHGLFFCLFAPSKFRAVEFGVFWKTLNPYCYCGEPVSRLQYLLALTMPGLILGAFTGVAAIVAGSGTWLIFSLVSFLLAGGDFMVAQKIFQYGKQGEGALFLDHPDKPGLLVFTKRS